MRSATLTIPIDSAGRIVIPQELRKHFGLTGKSMLKVIQTPKAIILEPVEETPKILNKNGWLVVVSEEPLPTEDILKKVREERIQKFVDPS